MGTYWTPKFKLWNAAGDVLLYTFPAVQTTVLPQNPQATVTLTNFRSSGAVVIGGGDKPFEENLRFWLNDTSYTNIMSQIMNLYTIIPVNTPLVLTMDVSQIQTVSYNVKRIEDFQWIGIEKEFRNYFQEVNLKLLCNAW